MKYILGIGLAVILAVGCGGAWAQPQMLPGDPAQGYMFALDSCAQCHIVTDPQAPPLVLAVPSFFDIANDRATTALSLRAFLQTPHDRMPDVMLKRTEIDNVISYILSLRGRVRSQPPAPEKPPGKPQKAKPPGGIRPINVHF